MKYFLMHFDLFTRNYKQAFKKRNRTWFSGGWSFKFFVFGSLQIVNRIQKLRKKIALEPTDIVEVYFESLDQDKSVAQRVLQSQVMFLSIHGKFDRFYLWLRFGFKQNDVRPQVRFTYYRRKGKSVNISNIADM